MTAPHRLLMCALAALVIGSAAPAQAQRIDFEQKLQDAYVRIDALSNLTAEQKQAQRAAAVEEITKAVEVFNQHIGDLQAAAEQLKTVGDMAGYDLKKVEEFSEKLKTLNESSVLKGMGTALEIKGQVEQISSIYNEAKALDNNQNLPPSTRRGLAVLQAFGNVMKTYGGSVPLMGGALETYGEIVDGIAKAAPNLKTTSAGQLDRALVAKEVLQGIPNAGSATPMPTDLMQNDLFIVEMQPDTGNRSEFYMRRPEGVLLESDTSAWIKVDYDKVKGIIADYKMMKLQERYIQIEKSGSSPEDKESAREAAKAAIRETTPGAKELYPFIQNAKNRAALTQASRQAARALALEPLRKEIARTVDPRVTSEQVAFAQNSLTTYGTMLNMPIDPARRAVLLREYFKDRNGLWKAMRLKTVLLHPGLGDMLRAQNKDPATMTMDEMAAAVRQWLVKAHAPAAQPVEGARPPNASSKLTNEQLCACINDFHKTITPRLALDNCRKGEGANCLRVDVQIVETFKLKYDAKRSDGPQFCGGVFKVTWVYPPGYKHRRTGDIGTVSTRVTNSYSIAGARSRCDQFMAQQPGSGGSAAPSATPCTPSVADPFCALKGTAPK